MKEIPFQPLSSACTYRQSRINLDWLLWRAGNLRAPTRAPKVAQFASCRDVIIFSR